MIRSASKSQFAVALLSLAAAAGAITTAAPASAIPTSSQYTITEVLAGVTGDVVEVGGVLFTAVGSFGVGTQSIVRIDGGGTTTIATGFNSVAGMAYDPINDRLLIGDNGGDLSGTLTGDTAYSLGSPLTVTGTPLTASVLEIFAAGSIPGIADLIVDPNDATGNTLILSDASGSFPPVGVVLSGDISGIVDTALGTSGTLGTLGTLATGFSFTAGLAADGDELFIGNALLAYPAAELSTLGIGASSDPLTLLSSLSTGLFDIELASDGALLATAGSDLLSIDPVTGVATVIATGFSFAAGLAEAGGTIYAIEGGFGVAALYELVPVPEPGTALLLGLGLAGLALRRRRV